jgi:hypothetical protein
MTHPITPQPELVQQWVAATESNDCIGAFPTNFEQRICTAAAQWGADQELEACCGWVHRYASLGKELRTSRRPKPLSLKEQALEALDEMQIEPCFINGVDANASVRAKYNTIRRALKALPND